MPWKLRTSWSLALLVVVTASLDAKEQGGGLGSFEDVQWETYRHQAPDFSLQYPYAYHGVESPGPGQIFTAGAALRVPSISVALMSQIEGLTLEGSAAAAAKRISPAAKVTGERTVDLGGVPARVADVEWTAPIGLGVALRTLIVSAYIEGQWVIVSATDGVTNGPMLPDLEKAAMSLRFGMPTAP
jgi:hypothetical protein